MANATLDTVLGLQVFAISGRPLDLGILGLAAFAPTALLVFVTGTIADRFNRRRVAAAGLAGEVVMTAALFVYISPNRHRSGRSSDSRSRSESPREFAGPRARALPADIVATTRVPWVVARSSVMWEIATIIGPVLGGFLYAANPSRRIPPSPRCHAARRGARARRATPATTMPAPMPDLPPEGNIIEPEEPATKATMHEAVEGLRFVRNQPIVLGVFPLDLFAVLFGGAVALLPTIAEERLHVGAVGVGWFRARGRDRHDVDDARASRSARCVVTSASACWSRSRCSAP